MTKSHNSEQIPPDESGKSDLERKYSHQVGTPRDIGMEAAAPAMPDELEGQLGPDELPDAIEVVMNQEAKQHH